MLAGGAGVKGAMRKKMFSDAKKKIKIWHETARKKNELLKCQQSADQDCF
jgi:hypothetical protein